MAMRYKILGRSGLRVSELSLGTMGFGSDWGWGSDEETSRAIFDTYAEHGGNFIDTANRYTNGTAEKYVGEFIAHDRDHFVLATKYSLFTQEGDPNKAGNHRKSMVHALEGSLRRLNTDYIDLYWLHAWDFTTPVEEVMRALDDMVRAGKVLHIAASDTPAWVVSRGNTLAELRGWSRFVAYQLEYSLIERTPEPEMIAAAQFYNMPVLAWSTIAGGLLTGKYSSNNTNTENNRLGDRRPNEREQAIIDAVQDAADATGRSPAQVATRWTMQRPGNVIPITGAKSVSQLEDTLQVVDFELSDEHMQQLNEVSAPGRTFPDRFLNAPHIRRLVTAGMDHMIEKR